jgi:uncharacterized protein YbjT (DUF2867 family)
MYVVTGATGNTGSVVAGELLAQGQKVRVIGRDKSRLRAFEAKGAEPFVADLTNAEALTRAFTGAQAVYLMIPPDVRNQDVRGYKSRISDAIARAVEQSGVSHAVSLSSIGADKLDRTGPVTGLHDFEEELDWTEGLNVLHLRAGYFMENTLAQAGLIQAFGITAGPLDPELKLPMIATRDIGMAASAAMRALDFSGHQARELLGQRDLTMTEVTGIIARAIGADKLEYRRVSDEQVRNSMLQFGMSENMADLLLEMSAALNSGYMRALEQRSARNTTPTSYETFVAEQFVPLYKKHQTAA